MLLTKEVGIKVNSYTVGYYESLGYKIPMKKATESTRKKYKKEYVYDFSTPIVIKIEDLQIGSHAKVDVLCDYCKENIITMTYKDYYKRMNVVKKHACSNCSHLKTYESNLLIYNVGYASQSEEIRKRTIETNMRRYGAITPAQNDNVLSKMKSTFIHKYGTSNPMQCTEIREKANETLCKNGTHKTSKQQTYLHSLLGGKINYPVSYYALDICFPEEKIVLEYDGGGHNLRATLGQLTKEEFDHKELVREKVIKSEGYKLIRIKSELDKLPSDQVLFRMLSESRNYFNTTSHSWCTYDIDKSLLFNAENKQGIPYDFGELRKIK